MKSIRIIILFLLPLLILGCQPRYERKIVPIRVPSTYPNMKQVDGIQIAAKGFYDRNEAFQVFGFDMLGAGILPVQVVFDHKGKHPIRIVPTQTFLQSADGNLWPVLRKDIAYERMLRLAREGEVGAGMARGSAIGAIAGAVIGAAIGIVTDSSIPEAAGKGAVIGTVVGGSQGAMEGAASPYPYQAISRDIKDRSLENRPIMPQQIAHGFLFFPIEASSAHLLRLQIKEEDTGKIFTLEFVL